MNYRKAIGVASTSLFLMVLLTKYNNCAPAPTSDSPEEADSEVRIIDDWSNEKLSFAETAVVTHDQAENINFFGLCARSVQGESLRWSIVGSSGEVETGETLCERGGFEIQAKQLLDLDCDEDYKIQAETESGGSDVVSLRRKCSPASRTTVSDDQDRGEHCDLELEVSHSGATSCYHSCYRKNRLLYREPADADSCPSLTAAK